VQTARESVGTAPFLIEFAARMQPRKHQLNDGGFFFGVQPDRDTSPIIFDGHAAVSVQSDLNVLTKAGQSLIGRIIENFLNDMKRVLSAGVHARPLAHRFKAFQHPNR
jgi:hypothetical protein